MQIYRIERDEDLPRILRMQQHISPKQCPFCLAEGEDRVENGTPEIDADGGLSVAGRCHDCGETWTSFFEFIEFV